MQVQKEEFAYQEGFELGKKRGGDVKAKLEILKRALEQCEEQGWQYLYNLFQGQIDGLEQGEQSGEANKEASQGA